MKWTRLAAGFAFSVDVVTKKDMKEKKNV